MNTIQQLRAALAAYDAAADKFIAKVERGDARSRETYAELKAARKLSAAIVKAVVEQG